MANHRLKWGVGVEEIAAPKIWAGFFQVNLPLHERKLAALVAYSVARKKKHMEAIFFPGYILK